jgi:Spy/CpxP family protein refolding chaperone
MSVLRWACLGAAAILSASVLVVADDATTQPAEAPQAAKHAKLTKPWSELTDLNDDQKAKIAAVHAKALEETKAIRDKETADIDAVLTDDQKKELTALEAKTAASRKAMRVGDAPATQPAS